MKQGKPATGKRILFLLIAAMVLVLILKAPLPESILSINGSTLTPTGRASLGILMFCLILWIGEPLPFHITGLFGLVLIALLNVDSFSSAIKIGLGNDTVAFFIGILILAAFMSRSGLGKRLLTLVLSFTGNNTSIILLGFLIVGALLAMWMTEMAAAAMLVPLATAMLEEEEVTPLQSNFGKALMIACAWGPVVGGIGTPAGAGPNQLAIGFINEMAGIEISFLDWMKFGLPSALLLILPTWLVLRLFFRPEMVHLKKTNEQLRAEFKNYAPMSKNERATLITLLITVALWLGSDALEGLLHIKIPTAMPAILGACLLFFPGFTDIKWSDIEKDISWSSILLIATGIALGTELYNSGAAEWLAVILLGGIAQLTPLLQILVIILVISLLKVGLSSNTVTATVIIPIMIVMAQNSNLPVLQTLIPASLTLPLALILVTSSPTNVIPYSAGYFKISDMAKAGTVLTLISSVILTFAIFIIGKLSGIY